MRKPPVLVRKPLALLFCLSLATAVFAGGSGSFTLDLKTDPVLLGSGTLVNLGALFLTPKASAPASAPSGFFAWPSFHYDGTQDDISTLLSVAGIAAFPLLLDRFTVDDVLSVGTMYAEVFLLTWGTKDLLKALFPKYRPYTAYADTPRDLLDERDRYFSFPSGHTAVAFATAGFSTSVFSRSDARSSVKTLFGVGAFSLAATVAALRVSSGSHYLIDVVSGAVLGTLYGVLVPELHRKSGRFSFDSDGRSVGLQAALK